MHPAHCGALLAAVAAMQVQMVLAQLSKKTVSSFAAGARYGLGGEGVVVWVTRGAPTPASQWSIVLQLGRCPKPGQGGFGPGHFGSECGSVWGAGGPGTVQETYPQGVAITS